MKNLLRAVLCALLLAAGALPARAAAPAAAPSGTAAVEPVGAAADWAPPLSTRGRYVVDARGDRFRLRSGNWDGAQGS